MTDIIMLIRKKMPAYHLFLITLCAHKPCRNCFSYQGKSNDLPTPSLQDNQQRKNL